MFIAQRRARAAENRRIYRISIVSQGNGTDQFLQRFADMRLPQYRGLILLHGEASAKHYIRLRQKPKSGFLRSPHFPAMASTSMSTLRELSELLETHELKPLAMVS